MGTEIFKTSKVDILVAYRGKHDPKQSNLKSVLESEVPFPVLRPNVRKVKKLSKLQILNFFEKFQTQYGLFLLRCNKTINYDLT